ncbi:hypothetical protein FB451DRAFT_1204619 [Mycena latifolia]|nr:hypothetical protein FB451DRAFT_1204619 [Mycena latifolia]
MSSIKVGAIPILHDLKPSNSFQFIDIVNSSTMDVDRVPVTDGPYHDHSGVLNDHDKELEHNEPGKASGFMNHIPSTNEVDNDAPSQRRRNIFDSLSQSKPQAQLSNHAIAMMRSNLAPALRKHSSELCTSGSTITSDIFTGQQSSMGASIVPITPPDLAQGFCNGTATWVRPQPQSDSLPWTDDYLWPLGEGLQDIQNQLKSKTFSPFPSSAQPHPHNAPLKSTPEKHKASGRQTRRELSASTSASAASSHFPYSTSKGIEPPRTPPILKQAKTIFTPPPPTPSKINDDHLPRTPSSDSRGTPSERELDFRVSNYMESLYAPVEYAKATAIGKHRSKQLKHTFELERDDATLDSASAENLESTAPTSPPSSPVFTDAGSGRAWSEEAALRTNRATEYSPATSPATLPVLETASEPEDVALGNEIPEYSPVTLPFTGSSLARSEETSLHGSAAINPAALPFIGGTEIPEYTLAPIATDTDGDWTVPEGAILQGNNVTGPEALFDDESSLFSGDDEPKVDNVVLKPVRPAGSDPSVTRREIKELNALRPKSKKPTQGKRAYHRKAKEEKGGAIRGPIVRLPTSKQTAPSRGVKRAPSPLRPSDRAPPARETAPSRGVKRTASPLRTPYTHPVKRPATQTKNVRTPSIAARALWTSQLTTFEDSVYQGKQGRNWREIEGLRKLLNEMIINAEAVPTTWLLEQVRLRTVNNEEERKDRPTMLEYVVDGYRGCDAEGEVDRRGKELLAKWGRRVNTTR